MLSVVPHREGPSLDRTRAGYPAHARVLSIVSYSQPVKIKVLIARMARRARSRLIPNPRPSARASQSGARRQPPAALRHDAIATSIQHRRYLAARFPDVEALADSQRYDLYPITGKDIPVRRYGRSVPAKTCQASADFATRLRIIYARSPYR